MQTAAVHFKRRAGRAMDDDFLQSAMRKTRDKFTGARAAAAAGFAGFERLRDRGAAARARAIAAWDQTLLEFERNAAAAGAQVLWAKDAESARRIVVAVARRHRAAEAIKSKSMICEEIALNGALAEAGIAPLETDLGEYILQLADEPPSHIVAPAMHKRREEIAALFAEKLPPAAKAQAGEDSPAALCRRARAALRPHLLNARMSVTGANFLVAETGAVVLVTNEGNGRFAATVPPVRVTVAGIDKVVQTRRDLAVLLKLLPRSATGQAISTYVSLCAGVGGAAESKPLPQSGASVPSRAADPFAFSPLAEGVEGMRRGGGENPRFHYIVLVDGGRSAMLQSGFAEMLRCIRCGACMNHCPVYQLIGGHAYGWVYPGPMGAVLTPLLAGGGGDLPHAATMCGACEVVCPVKIPLPALMRKLRERQADDNARPFAERAATRLWAFCAGRPALYAAAAALAAAVLKLLAGRRGAVTRLPLAQEWFYHRDLPAPEGETFRRQYRASRPARPG